ncbi:MULTISPECIES: hypothetical protein [Prosthecochloris]|uniref:DUF3352 domain-containing protein n=1 Tax=Prosthecochloris vibrioformis TaxID=1098 RepID=A0A5C4S251_PROVB|nr:MULTISPECIES: hypothetical protein [Prosthecochloris]ANT64362.1 hypothetical protein Ptc2401_00563 [Prosthecochloris sp. CIB 2401]TNJ37217.1 hypothetical protein FGF68_03055 [Prosthecochloris vibrioformis]
MQTEPRKPTSTKTQKQPRKKPSLLLITLILGSIGLILQLLWVNWPKQRQEPEQLPQRVHEVIDRLPGTSDALIYVGLADIRATPFWNEVVPDSVKTTDTLPFPSPLNAIMAENGFRPVRDIDALLVDFQHQNSINQQFLAVVWGRFPDGLHPDHLISKGYRGETIAGMLCTALQDDLWLCMPGKGMALLASSPSLIERHLNATPGFFERDSTTTALIDRAIHKSQFWFTLSSTNWTSGALQSLMSQNSELASLGNLRNIRQLVLSLDFKDGITGESEWIYDDRQAAYFASTFLWGAIKLSSATGTRTAAPVKELLRKIEVMQNLESVIIKAELPQELFTVNPPPGT